MRFLFSILALLASFNALAISSPSVGANVLFLSRNSNFHKYDTDFASPDQKPNGINVREAELQFYADVDPYTRLNLVLAVAPKYTSDGTKVSESWGIEPEQATAESNVVPNLTLKIGKFKAAMGKHNTLHTHAYPFVEAPLANIKLLGDEGLNDIGVSAAILAPSSWFNELTFQYLRGKGENDEFKSPSPGMGVGLVHWKNLFDLSDSLTLELGASYAGGGNSYRQSTSLTGADLTFKWRPVEGGKYVSVLWATEYLSRQQSQTAVSDEKAAGLTSWVQYQFAERWSALYRYENLIVKDTFDPAGLPNDTWERNSAGLQYAPSEFSSYRFEYNQGRGGPANADGETTERAFFIQASFTIGAHPSHSY